MSKYRVASQAGAEWLSTPEKEVAVGDEVELTLDDEQERAVIAAGWLEPASKKGKEG